MRLLRFTRRHPIALLSVIAVAFVGWIWWDALPTRETDPARVETRGLHDANGPLRRPLPPAPDGVADALVLREDATRGLAKLKPGMTRAEVEKLVGAPAADRVSPATVADGRVTYLAAYETDFGPLPTVRPVMRTPRTPPVARNPEPVERTLITLEFDATKPGHPLLGIHYPDPLF